MGSLQTYCEHSELERPWPMVPLGDLVDLNAERYAQRDAIVFGEQRYTYRDLRNEVDSFGKGLLALGVQKGEHVGLLMGNSSQFEFAELAAVKIGAVMVPINTRFKITELDYVLGQTDISTLVTTDLFLGKIDYMGMLNELCPELATADPGALRSARLPKLRNVIICSATGRDHPGTFRYTDVVSIGRSVSNEAMAERQRQVKVQDTVQLLLTSGTTGYPKGAMLNHYNVQRQTQISAERMAMREREVVYNPNPFFHNLGNNSGLALSLTTGATHVIAETFDPGLALREIAREGATIFSGYSAFYVMILDHPDLPNYDLKATLRTGMCGFAGVRDPVALLAEMKQRLGLPDLISGYGMTECSGCTTLNRAGDSPENIATTIGRLCNDFEVAIVNPETKRSCAPGEPGELWARGRQVMKGYYNKPVETDAAIDSDGWFHTKDLISRDSEGVFRFCGRLSDMIKVGGESVDPLEVERVIGTNAKVVLAQVTSVPDRRLGDVPVAFVQLKPGEVATESEIIDFCKARIASFKVPRQVRIVSEFPLTPSGKIQKYVLREGVMKELGL